MGVHRNIAAFFQSELGQMSFLPMGERFEAYSFKRFSVRAVFFFIKHYTTFSVIVS
jgi:hypothetical protein